MSGQVWSFIWVMSAPAAKAFSLPVMTTAPTDWSASKISRAPTTSSMTVWLRALSAFGRFSVIVATPSATEVRIVSYVGCESVMVAIVSRSSTPRVGLM